jgi:hypothetical protein
MSNVIMPIDLQTLQAVTGGSHKNSSSALLTDISNLASQIKDVAKQTSGFDSTQLLLLCCVALQRQNANPYAQTNVVYYSRSGRRW